MMPALIHGNAALSMDYPVQDDKQIKHRNINILSLEVDVKVPCEGVQGYIRWTTFEARESGIKIVFEERLRRTARER